MLDEKAGNHPNKKRLVADQKRIHMTEKISIV
jgi:hypothetical protein